MCNKFMTCYNVCVISMETSLLEIMEKEGISEESIGILVTEEVVTLEIFSTLKEEHFQRLLPKMKVGQHAMIRQLHAKHTDKKVSYISLF